MAGWAPCTAASGAEVWVATLGAVTSAVGAYALAQRYQRLAATFRLMIDRMGVRYVSWSVASQAGAAGADQAFIVDIEPMLSAEIDAWVADFMSKPASAPTQGAMTTGQTEPVAER